MIAAIVQARTGSARLPRKVLRRAAGKTLLEHLVERLGFARHLDCLMIATSALSGDDAIERLCQKIGVPCFRGSETDVLDRYYQAATLVSADVVVRITGDCPLIDAQIVDQVVVFQQSHADEYDLVTNRYPLTFPDGLDVDVMPLGALKIAWERAETPYQREHVIPYFWEAGLRVKNIEHDGNLFRQHRWTIDYEEDVALVTAIFEGLYRRGGVFGMDDILRFVALRPDLHALNAKYLPG